MSRATSTRRWSWPFATRPTALPWPWTRSTACRVSASPGRALARPCLTSRSRAEITPGSLAWIRRTSRIGSGHSRDRNGGMRELLPSVYLARHGETAWSLSGQHTGRTDLPLTERGERNARALGEPLRGLTFANVLTSPLRRALQTCELAGFGGMAEIDPDLVEWDYGQYEGRR